jgi:hypothetical protein
MGQSKTISHSLRATSDNRKHFSTRGKWENAPIHRVLLSLSRRRPRDLIKLLYGGAKEAFRNDHDKISTSDLRNTFESYSNERLQDIVNEFKTELPGIGRLVHGMRPTTKERTTLRSYLYTNDELMLKLRSLMGMNDFRFANGTVVSAKALAEFLYKKDFITARKDKEEGDITPSILIRIGIYKVNLRTMDLNGRFIQPIGGRSSQATPNQFSKICIFRPHSRPFVGMQRSLKDLEATFVVR